MSEKTITPKGLIWPEPCKEEELSKKSTLWISGRFSWVVIIHSLPHFRWSREMLIYLCRPFYLISNQPDYGAIYRMRERTVIPNVLVLLRIDGKFLKSSQLLSQSLLFISHSFDIVLRKENMYFVALKAIFNNGKCLEIAKENPATSIPALKVNNVLVRYLPDE